MGIHFGIITSVGNAKNEEAFFDIANLDGAQSARFTVFQTGGNRVATVPFDGPFMTSPDLLSLDGPVTVPAIVSAETLNGMGLPDNSRSSAMLRLRTAALPTPRFSNTARDFLIPVGDLGSTAGKRNGAMLIVGNPGSTAFMNVDWFVNGLLNGGTVAFPESCVVIPLLESHGLVEVHTTFKAVVALAIEGKGQDFEMTLIPPVA